MGTIYFPVFMVKKAKPLISITQKDTGRILIGYAQNDYNTLYSGTPDRGEHSYATGYLNVGLGDYVVSPRYNCLRSVMPFDTTPAAGKEIVKAYIILTVQVIAYHSASHYIDVVSGLGVSEPAIATDYIILSSHNTSYGSVYVSSPKVGDILTIELNSQAIAEINAAGVTNFALRVSEDMNHNIPPNPENTEWLYGTLTLSKAPKLQLYVNT